MKKMEPNTLVFVATALVAIGTAISAYAVFAMNKENDKKIEEIHSLDKLNNELSTEIRKLTSLNSEIASSTKEIVEENRQLAKQNIGLTDDAQKLIAKVEILTKKSSMIIKDINDRTAVQYNQNKKSGHIDLNYNPLDIVPVVSLTTAGSNTISIPISRLETSDGIQINDAGIYPFSLKKVKNKLFLSMEIKDQTGKVALSIEDNFWTKYNGDFKFNYDDHGFEIFNSDNKVLFNIDVKNDFNIIFINGIFFTNNNILVIGKKLVELPTNSSLEEIYKSYKEAEVPQLFEYDRENYLGKRRKKFWEK